MKTKLFGKDFSMVVVGQIISLFGNNVLRYALPLYLLNMTGSAALYGTVTALSFIPMLLLSPIGGLIADRVNKRNVMVVLDFFTAFIMIIYALSFEVLPIVPLLIAVLMLLYGIQGAYQPTVQAAVPALTPSGKLMAGNAVINMVNSLAQITGPVLGGLIFGFYGLKPILYISIICFICSAVMEIFIHIPFQKQHFNGSVFEIASHDMRESWSYIHVDHPEILKIGLLITAINLVFSALILIGLPVVINTHLGFEQDVANRLYGYAEGALAAGGLLGGLLSGMVQKKLRVTHSAWMILLCSLSLLPIGAALMFRVSGIASFFVITTACFLMMVISTIFSVEMITYVQKVTPSNLIGKIMALLTCLALSGNPIGQLVYGALFEKLAANIHIIYFGAFIICMVLCAISHRIFQSLDDSVIGRETMRSQQDHGSFSNRQHCHEGSI